MPQAIIAFLESTDFEDAILRPLKVKNYRLAWTLGSAARLACAFTQARQRNPDAPLTPELQV
ncbi:MAG: hypothetical protein ACO1G6_10090, partial [Bacteroidota bacterium]